MQIPQTLVILSGLPGSGKSTMATMLIDELKIPVLAIDDVVDAIPDHLKQTSSNFWQDMVQILLQLVDCQLSWGNSILVDSVFMGVDENYTIHQWSDRYQAFQIAQKHQIRFRPIYMYISNENLWRNRLKERAEKYPDAPVATWSQVKNQRKLFQPWKRGQALFIDSLHNPDDNFTRIMDFIISDEVQLKGWV